MSALAATAGIAVAVAQLITGPGPRAVHVERTPNLIQPFPPAHLQPGNPPPASERPHPDARAAVVLEPKVVCGTAVIPVPSTADQRMVKPVPSDTTYHIRSVRPPICSE